MKPSIVLNKDYANQKITITCKFKAPLDVIWDVFTNSDTMEKWFAPKPYQAVTEVSDFRNGGQWLYYMLSPEEEKTWGVTKYSNIRLHQSFEASDAFCDENGIINENFPQMSWRYHFSENKGEVTVTAEISFSNQDDMKKILEMGFEEGYKIALTQLYKLLK